MQGPQGRLLRAAFARLAGLTAGMDPRFGAKTLANAQNLLMRDVAGAGTPTDLAAMVGPNASADAVGRSLRTASAGASLNAGGTAGTLYADAGGGMITDAGGLAVPLSAPAGDAPTEHLVAAAGSSGFGGGAFGKTETAPQTFLPKRAPVKPVAQNPAVFDGGGSRALRTDWKDGTPKDRMLRKQFAELDTYDPAKPLEAKIAAMPKESRLMATSLIDDKELTSKPDAQRKFLLLCDVSPKAVQNVFDPNVRSDAFRNSLTVDMLPADMRRPTQTWIDAGTAWVDGNQERIRDFKVALDGSTTATEREQMVRAIFADAETAMGISGIKVEFGKTPSGQPLETSRKSGAIIVDVNHRLFSTQRNDNYFSDMIGSVLHEIVHTRQIAASEDHDGRNIPINTIWIADRKAEITTAALKKGNRASELEKKVTWHILWKCKHTLSIMRFATGWRNSFILEPVCRAAKRPAYVRSTQSTRCCGTSSGNTKKGFLPGAILQGIIPHP